MTMVYSEISLDHQKLEARIKCPWTGYIFPLQINMWVQFHMAYHFKHSQCISATGVENCNKAANALALSAESFSVSDSSLASGQITFLLFPSFFSTMIKATSPTVIHSTSSSHLPCSQIQKTHSRHGRVLSATNHIHTLFETHITVHYHQQSLPQTRKSNN